MNYINRPIIPYRGPISGGLHEGKQILIRGHVPYGADRFTVNLAGADADSDRPFHVSVRFNGNIAVRNTMKEKSYGSEERSGPFPFAKGQSFTMAIRVERSAYSVSVNGKHCFDYCHRIPITRVSSILIDGDVQIDSIEYINAIPTQSPAVYSPPSTPVRICPSPGFNAPPSPCTFPIYGGIRPSMCIYISGRPSANPQRFTINLQNGTSTYSPSDIAFMFDARFYTNSVIRNSRTNNVWDLEEAMISHFPFRPGVNFDIMIRVQSDGYVVSVNGQHFISFRHRMNAFSCINTLYIENDVIVNSIRYT